MKEAVNATKDPICGMTVNPGTAPSAERDGKKFYFCCDRCREKFASASADAVPEDKSGCCCS